MAVGELLPDESTARRRHLPGGAPARDYWLPQFLRWSAWFNDTVSMGGLTAGLPAGWHLAEIGIGC